MATKTHKGLPTQTDTIQPDTQEINAYGFFNKSSYFLDYAKQFLGYNDTDDTVILDIANLRPYYKKYHIHLIKITEYWWLACTRMSFITWNQASSQFRHEPSWLEYVYLSLVMNYVPISLDLQTIVAERTQSLYNNTIDAIYNQNPRDLPSWVFAKTDALNLTTRTGYVYEFPAYGEIRDERFN